MAGIRSITTSGAPAPSGPFSQAAVKGPLIATCGQVGMDPVTREYVSDDAAEQTRQALKNLVSVLNAAGAGVEDVISVRIFVTDVADMARINEPYTEVFSEPFPARTTVVVGLPGRMLVEIDALAVRDPSSEAGT